MRLGDPLSVRPRRADATSIYEATAGETSTYTMKHEYALKPGDQVTFAPGTAHWFQAGSEGAVVWSFSTRADDVSDIFTDTKVVR